MKAIYEIMRAQTKLEVGAQADLSADKLRTLMKEVAADLFATSQDLSVLWAELGGVMKKLEKGIKK